MTLEFLFYIFLIISCNTESIFFTFEERSLDLIQQYLQHELIKDNKGTVLWLKVMLLLL